MSELRRLLMQHPKGVTLIEIAAHLHVTERSARRYLAELTFDLESEPERPGGQKRWRIPAVDLPRRVALRRTQAYALLAAKPLFDAMAGSTLFEEIDLAAQTLLAVARRPGRGPNAGVQGNLEERFRYVPFAPKDYAAQAEELDALFEAVADLRPLSCRYPRASDGVLERRVVHPLAVVLYKDAISCLARDPDEGTVQTLALGLMRGARTTDGECFAVPEDFDLDDYVQGQFGLWRAEGTLHEVVIELDATVADYVMTRTVHPSQRVDEIDNGVRLTFDIADLTEVTTWVLGFGSLAKVIAPKELQQGVRDELARTLERYED
jgi:predicted DNA-binding transcriptional regulator YafY